MQKLVHKYDLDLLNIDKSQRNIKKLFKNENIMHKLRDCERGQLNVIHSNLFPSASEGWGKVMFSVCSPLEGRGYPRLWSQSLLEGYPSLCSHVPSTGGTPVLSQVLLGSQDWVPPSPTGTGYTAGSTSRVVSCRRTFLFQIKFHSDIDHFL